MHFSYEDLRPLALQLADLLPIKRPIITFSRGGLDTVALVARYLSWKPTVYSFDPADTNHSTASRLAQFVLPVFIDDLLDTGRTFENVSRVFPRIHASPYLVLFDKQTEKRIATPPNLHAAQTIVTEEWIVFPWELQGTNS